MIELALTLGIIGILSSVAAMSAIHMRERAKMSIYYGAIHDIKMAAMNFKDDMGFFPPDVNRGVDPCLIAPTGYQEGGHSPQWEEVDMRMWNGPYLSYKTWPNNPWGGKFEWDNFPEGNEFAGIPKPGIYLSLKPDDISGRGGMPSLSFEQRLQETGVDDCSQIGQVAVFLSKTNTTAVAAN